MISDLLCFALGIYLLVLFARVLLSWVPITPGGMVHQIAGVLIRITEPVMAPARRIIPPIRTGGLALDLSPIIVFLALMLLRSLIC